MVFEQEMEIFLHRGKKRKSNVFPWPIATYTIDNISMPTPPGIMDTLSGKMFGFVMKTIQSLQWILAWFVCNSDHQNVQETEVCGHSL